MSEHERWLAEEAMRIYACLPHLLMALMGGFMGGVFFMMPLIRKVPLKPASDEPRVRRIGEEVSE